uniref:Uncharacterized protein n=1 Tax=Cacopsylla melanoneura TaxID=428564 RepID=A0A8D8WYH9_9HEMI
MWGKGNVFFYDKDLGEPLGLLFPCWLPIWSPILYHVATLVFFWVCNFASKARVYRHITMVKKKKKKKNCSSMFPNLTRPYPRVTESPRHRNRLVICTVKLPF